MLGITEVAIRVDRMAGTIRKWEREGVLPNHLLPQRDEQNRRYWTEEQVQGIIDWIKETDRRPGKGLPHYNPTPEKLHEHLVRQRRQRS